MNAPHPASYAWAGLVLYVLAADTILIKSRRKTMSSVFREAIHHPTKRLPVTMSWGLLTAHLFTTTKYDPISIAGRWLANKEITS
jgi:hypothetical protein